MANKKQAFSVRLNRDAYNMLMRQPQSMRIELGESASFMFIDDRPFNLNLRREQSTIQVYEKNQQTKQDDDYRIQYVGDITHVGHMKQVLSEEDKKRVRNRTQLMEKEKNARRIELLDVPSLPTPTRIHHDNSTPTATFSPAKRNSLLSPSATKNSSLSPSSKSISPISSSSGGMDGSRLEGAALQSLRERLIHLLALDPRPADQLTQMLKVASVDLHPLLKKVAVYTNSGWCLRPDIFKEIRIWEWTRYDDKERATVCRKAEEAYDFLKLPRNAPERANLLQRKPRKPSPKLIPPPSQHTPTMGSNHISHAIKPGSSTPSSETTAINGNRKHGRTAIEEHSINKLSTTTKKRKLEKPTKPKPSESIHPSLPSTKQSISTSPANLTPTKKSSIEVKKLKPSTAIPRSIAKESSTLHDLSGTDLDDDDDHDGRHTSGSSSSNKAYVAPIIQTQVEFDMLCKEHYDTQQDYIQFKKTFVQNHPIYIQALTAVNEQDKDLFARKLKAYYKSKGGDMNKWRHLMQLSRRFNGTHAKINIMWDTIEKAYRQKRFTLRLNRLTSSSSSSSPYSASSSASPLSAGASPLPPPRTASAITSSTIKRTSRRH